jgi:4-hydroxybenzoate polyprenyltransferase
MPTMVRQFLELVRFSHTLFALPFALLSAWLAWQTTLFRLQDLIGILLCMVFARSAAMSFNRLVDRDLDAENPRTAGRHLPAGLLSVRSVAAFTLVNCLLFVASTVLFFPNRWPLILSVPVLLFLLGYSYAKRFTSWCHYWLSAALMLAPIAAWIAITGTLTWTPVWIAAAVFFWVGGFDVIYACQDADFDRQRSLNSLPARWGIRPALRIARLSHLGTVACLFALWHVAELGPVFLSGIIVVTLLLAYEHWLVRTEQLDLDRVNVAFFQVNAVISLGLLAVAILDRLTS